MCKATKIRSIVWLRRTLRRWRSRAAAAGRPRDAVPAGHVAVCVGGASRRFVVLLAHLNHPAFRQLLRQAEEEYGFPSASGPIELPCDEALFRDALRRASSSPSRFPDELGCCFCHGVSRGIEQRGESRPLLQGMAMAVEKLVW